MDINETLDSDYSQDFAITSEIKDYLQETAKWAYFLAIVGFVSIGLMVIAALFMGAFLGSMPGTDAMPFSPAIFSVVYIIMAVIIFFPILYLFRFASNMKVALRENNDAVLATAFSYLKSHYKFYGIFTAVMIGLYLLMFLIVGVGALFAS